MQSTLLNMINTPPPPIFSSDSEFNCYMVKSEAWFPYFTITREDLIFVIVHYAVPDTVMSLCHVFKHIEF